MKKSWIDSLLNGETQFVAWFSECSGVEWLGFLINSSRDKQVIEKVIYNFSYPKSAT